MAVAGPRQFMGGASHPDATARPCTLNHSHLLSERSPPSPNEIRVRWILVAVTGLVDGALRRNRLLVSSRRRAGAGRAPIGHFWFVALDAAASLASDARGPARRWRDGVSARTQRVVLTSGGATVSAAGRLVSLSAAVIKDGSRWLVPIDFLRVLDPLLNRRIEMP